MECCCDIPNDRPDTEPCRESLNVPEIIRDFDVLANAGRNEEADEYLRLWRKRAHEAEDWRAELSIVSEQLGHCRKTGDEALALECAETAQAMINEHRLAYTVSGATVLLNAATTLKCFGRAEKSLPIFSHVARVFSDNLDPHDYRMGGLYNNMALSYVDIGRFEEAEKYFRLALTIVSDTVNPGNDVAVTYCNMAEMYAALDSEDGRIEEYLDRAYEALCEPSLPHDGYHAYTISKCLPTFERYGFFLYVKELRERMESIRSARL